MRVYCTEIDRADTPCEPDVVVLCEVLEHLPDPARVVQQWLPWSKASVISHPLDEEENCGLSAGDHQWSFSEQDFKSWFELGGHRLVHQEIFQMGGYKIIMGMGVNVKTDLEAEKQPVVQ